MTVFARVSQNFSLAAQAKVVQSLTPLLVVPLMIDRWGLELYGEWIIVTAIPAYLMFSPDLGLGSASSNRVAVIYAEGDRSGALDLFGAAFWALMIAAVLLLIVISQGLKYVDSQWFHLSLITPEIFAGIVLFSSVQILVFQCIQVCAGLYRCAESNPRLAKVYLWYQIFFSCATLSALWFSAEPLEVAMIMALVTVGYGLYVLADAHSLNLGLRLKLLTFPKFALLKPLVVPGLGHAGLPLINAFQNQGLIILIGVVIGPMGVASFQTIRIMSNSLKSITTLYAGSVLVELPTLLGKEQHELVTKLLIRILRLALLISLPLALLTVAFGEEIYRLWLGLEIRENKLTFLLLIASVPIFALSQSPSIKVLAQNRVHEVIRPLIIAVAISLLLTWYLAVHFGLPGAGLGVLIWELGLMLCWFRSADMGGEFYLRLFRNRVTNG